MSDDLNHCMVPEKATDYEPIDEKSLSQMVLLLAAMNDPARIQLLFLLHEYGTLCVSALASLTGDKPSTLSMRLKKLHDAKLLTRSRDAKHVFYSLRDSHVVTILENLRAHAMHL